MPDCDVSLDVALPDRVAFRGGGGSSFLPGQARASAGGPGEGNPERRVEPRSQDSGPPAGRPAMPGTVQ